MSLFSRLIWRTVVSGVGVGVGGAGVGLGEGIGSDDGTSNVWIKKTCPPLVRNAKPFAPQRIKLVATPMTPGTSNAPSGARLFWSKARKVRTALFPVRKKMRPAFASA